MAFQCACLIHYITIGKPAIVGFGDVEGWDSIHKARRLRSHLRPIIKAVKDADILWTNQDYQAWANTPVGANLVEITLPAATDPVSVSDIVCLTGDLWPDRGILNVWGLFTTERLNAPYQAYGQHLSIHELDESPPTFLIMDMSFAVALCAAYKKGSADSIGEYIDRITSAQPDHLGFLAWVDDRLEPFIIDLKRSRIRHDPNALDEGHVAALRWLTGFLSGTSCTVWNIHASTFGIGDEFGLSALATLEEAFAISARVPIPHWTLSADAMRSYILALVVGGYIQGVALGKAGAVDKAVK